MVPTRTPDVLQHVRGGASLSEGAEEIALKELATKGNGDTGGSYAVSAVRREPFRDHGAIGPWMAGGAQ